MDKVEIDGDTADGIVRASLKDSIACLRGSIKKYKSKKRLTEWEKQDMTDACLSLDHLEKTFDYYGGNIN
jgi:hypothetical protein